MTLTPRQLDTLQYLHDHRANRGEWPTLAAGMELGVSKVTVLEHVNNLVKRGWLKRYGSRDYRITHPIPRRKLRFVVRGTISRRGVEMNPTGKIVNA